MNSDYFWLGVVLLFAAALILPRLFPEPVTTAAAPEPTPLTWDPERRRWCQKIVFAGQVIDVSLDGDLTGPSADAMGTWLDLRSHLDETWQSVIKFALRESARNGVQLYEPDEIGIQRIDLCPDDPAGRRRHRVHVRVRERAGHDVLRADARRQAAVIRAARQLAAAVAGRLMAISMRGAIALDVRHRAIEREPAHARLGVLDDGGELESSIAWTAAS